MPHLKTRLNATLALLVACVTFTSAEAQDGLKTIDNPGGGQLVYGSLAGQSSLPAAMGFMLRQVRAHFGDRPRIGKFFQTKDAGSVATFFNLTVKIPSGSIPSGKPLSGLVIVTVPRTGAPPAAAVLYDDADRFARTEPAMMQALDNAWRNEAIQYAASQPARNSEGQGLRDGQPTGPEPAIQTLHQATAGDRSASIGMAPGWKIVSVAGGHLRAEGPSGEVIDIDGMFQQIHDPRSMQNRRMPSGNNGPTFVAPVNGDLFASYVSLVNQARQSQGKPPASFHLVSSKKIPPRAVEAIFELDLHDGKGMRKGSVRLDPLITPGVPTWALTVTGSNAPETVFASSNPVMMAMYKTYSQDRNVIGREQQAVLNGIAAAGARSRANAAAADARRISSSAAFNQHMDDIDRSSKSFQNYQFDRSQLQDNTLNARGTVDNRTADALVQAYPDRYQIITRPDFIRGVDY
jgi:hypothetical protein